MNSYTSTQLKEPAEPYIPTITEEEEEERHVRIETVRIL
jgi:hypothetical protein